MQRYAQFLLEDLSENSNACFLILHLHLQSVLPSSRNLSGNCGYFRQSAGWTESLVPIP